MMMKYAAWITSRSPEPEMIHTVLGINTLEDQILTSLSQREPRLLTGIALVDNPITLAGNEVSL